MWGAYHEQPCENEAGLRNDFSGWLEKYFKSVINLVVALDY